jgi:hypothetical protein
MAKKKAKPKTVLFTQAFEVVRSSAMEWELNRLRLANGEVVETEQVGAPDMPVIIKRRLEREFHGLVQEGKLDQEQAVE